MNEPTATLLISCPDRPGLVAKIANFIYANRGNIIHADRHTDFATSLFLIRLEWQLQSFNLPRETIAIAFSAIAKPLNATWQLNFSEISQHDRYSSLILARVSRSQTIPPRSCQGRKNYWRNRSLCH